MTCPQGRKERKVENIKLPALPVFIAELPARACITWEAGAIAGLFHDHARQAVLLNHDTSREQRSDAWGAVCAALSEVAPGWLNGEATGQELALRAIRDLGRQAKELAVIKDTATANMVANQTATDDKAHPRFQAGYAAGLQDAARNDTAPAASPEPFDLDKAKAGEPLVTRDGRKATFVGHAPTAGEDCRVYALIDGDEQAEAFRDDGLYWGAGALDADLFMAPKPARVVFVNLYRNGFAGYFESDVAARNGARGSPIAVAVAVAVPVTIPA